MKYCLFRSLFLVAVLIGCTSLHGRAEPLQDAGTVPALLVSDIHFDPLHDPSKAKRLAEAPVSQWEAILSAPDARDQAQTFAALQKKCSARGVDTPYPLLRSSLDAMRAHAADAQFIAVSGDLVVHQLPCRLQALLPGASQASDEAFVEKTLEFVVRQITAGFPGVPVYVALGNNDSGCGDYRVDRDSAFLAKAGQIYAAALPGRERRSVMRQFRSSGSYSVSLPPLHKTRLIVLNDIYLSPQYATCKGRPDPAAAKAELDWLSQQLDRARAAGEHVWVMGHIPTGVNAFETVRRFRNLCSGETPDLFLVPEKSARLDAILQQHADVVRLVLFGHTHMDEMRIITPASNEATVVQRVAVKLVPSLSPVNGNDPSFTVAQVEKDGTLKDYSVFVASNLTGMGTTWSQEYDYADAYYRSDFSASAVTNLIDGFRNDPRAQQPASRAYIHHYFKGKIAGVLAPFWPQYECSLDKLTPQDYTQCVCAQHK